MKIFPKITATLLIGLFTSFVSAFAAETNRPPAPRLQDALPPAQWARVETAVDRALAWLAENQQPDGSYPGPEQGQPAITSLCVMAFLSRGHQPGLGPFGEQMNRAIEYTLKGQKDEGLITYGVIEPSHVHNGPSHTGIYNHAIAGLMLSEVYGSVSGEQSKRIKAAVQKALDYTYKMQRDPPRDPADKGGWRYIRRFSSGPLADLSVTSWHLMFLRSAKNAEFTVSDQVVQSAMDYVRSCYDDGLQRFRYRTTGTVSASRGMAGAGILCLSMGGEHQSPIALRAGKWILANPFQTYGQVVGGKADRFHYGAYYCSQAMAQLGGEYWTGFFPPLVKTMLESQTQDGSWQVEFTGDGDAMYGRAYTTALSVLTLTPPLQLLPIYQR